MATERQAPDAILAQTALTGTLADIDEDPDAPDANWLTASGNNVNTAVRTSFATPTGSPTVGAGLQEFRFQVRRTSGSGTVDPTVRAELWENGSLVRAGSDNTVTSDAGQVFAFTWNANELGTSDGSVVELKVVGTKSGGSPTKRSAVDVGAVEWNVEFSAGTTIDATSVALTLSEQAATIKTDVSLTATSVAAALTVQQATVKSNIAFTATSPVVGLTTQGGAVTINPQINAQVASASLSPLPATVLSATSVNATTASIVYSMSAASLNIATPVNAQAASAALSTSASSVKVDISFTSLVSSLTLSSLPATLNVATQISAVAASLSITAQAATVEEGGGSGGGQVLADGPTMGYRRALSVSVNPDIGGL